MSYSSASRAPLDMRLDDHYSPYSPPDSPCADEDENASLRSQALNADGTPKRPMNAFMIFARRRRPQVSAANQMMRTGEISKILSKEWNTMPMSDKQFYLDQAKKLKENFNAKYPDYVYRRRPNNSRKKRRTDASTRGVDAYGDPREDSLSPHEHSPEYAHHHHHHHHSASVSPVDGLVPNEQSVSLAAHQYRLPYSSSAHHYHADPAGSGYPYYAQSRHAHHAHAHHGYDALAAFPPGGGGSGSGSGTHSPGIYHPEDDALLGAGAFPRLEPIKLEHAWGSGLSARRGTLAPPPLRQAHHGRHWSDGSGSTASPSAPSFPPFQTLTAPFYPSSGTVSPSTASSSSAASYFGGAAAAERDYDSHSHSHSNSHAQSHSNAHAHSHATSQAQSQPQAHAHAHDSPPFSGAALHQPRTYTGPTLGSTLGTLALSPGNAGGLWSSVRGSAAASAAASKSEL